MAAIPATLAFFAIFMQVHYRAVQLGIQGIPKSDLPSLKKTFLEGWHHLLSMVLLIYLLPWIIPRSAPSSGRFGRRPA